MVDPSFDFNYWISDIENHYDPCARVIEDIHVNGDTIYLSWGAHTGINADGPLLHRSVTLSTASGSIEAVSGDVDSFNSFWDNPSYQYMLGTYD